MNHIQQLKILYRKAEGYRFKNLFIQKNRKRKCETGNILSCPNIEPNILNPNT